METKNKKIRLAILSSYTVKNIQPFLQENLTRAGFDSEIKFGGYNQFVQELLDKGSWLHSFNPDIIFIALNSRTYLEDLEFNILDKSKKELEEMINERADYLRRAIRNAPSSSKVILTSLDYFAHSPYGLMDHTKEYGLNNIVEQFNKKIVEIKKELANVEILDFERISALYGKLNIFDEKMFFLGKISLSKLGAEKLADEMATFVKAIYGVIKKIFVVDLDNTLWKGVLGEDGPNGIVVGEGPIGEIYKEIQQILLNYKKMGVLLAISSKNNEKDVIEAFEKNRNMIVKLEDFIVKKINWKAKSLNIKEIAKELNIGLESFVFLDDNPAERLEVKTNLPMVEVIDFPEDVALLPRVLRSLNLFKSISLTEEDKKRHEMYSQEAKRNELKNSNSMEYYLFSLETKINVKCNDISSVERITQLINKTNQFNLRTQRYTIEQVSEMMKDGKHKVFSLSVKDKFGDLGLTGVAIISSHGNNYFIDSLLLSCRILSRDIEKQFFIEITKNLEKSKKIEAEYIQTAKNEQVKEFYDKIGFKLESNQGDLRRYSKLLKDLNLDRIKWIGVENG